MTLFSGLRSEEVEEVDRHDGATICAEWRGQEEGCRVAFLRAYLEDPGVRGADERYKRRPERNVTREPVLGLSKSASLGLIVRRGDCRTLV